MACSRSGTENPVKMLPCKFPTSWCVEKRFFPHMMAWWLWPHAPPCLARWPPGLTLTANWLFKWQPLQNWPQCCTCWLLLLFLFLFLSKTHCKNRSIVVFVFYRLLVLSFWLLQQQGMRCLDRGHHLGEAIFSFVSCAGWLFFNFLRRAWNACSGRCTGKLLFFFFPLHGCHPGKPTI